MQDPSTDRSIHTLSPETDRLLDHELRQITGDPTAKVSRSYRARFHAPGIADLIELRLGLTIGVLILALVVAVALISTGGALVLSGAFVLLLAATAVVVLMTLGLTRPTEHPSPELDAALVAEGVGDPDCVLTDLVREFEQRSADPSRPAA